MRMGLSASAPATIEAPDMPKGNPCLLPAWHTPNGMKAAAKE
jgi:hypothetical protein